MSLNLAFFKEINCLFYNFCSQKHEVRGCVKDLHGFKFTPYYSTRAHNPQIYIVVLSDFRIY